MAQLKVSLLGPFQVTLDDRPITNIEYIKGQALLAYLIIEADYPHSRDTLAEMLWPDQPQGVARRNLRQVIFNLRQALDADEPASPFLLITRQTVQFNTNSDYWLDVSAFSALVSGCLRHPQRRSEGCKYCAHRLERAVALYRGNFLAHLSVSDSPTFEEWVLMKQEWLRRQALESLAHLAQFYEGRGAYRRARQYARRQLDLDSWREETYRQLMRLHAWLGDRSAALNQYQSCRRILATELGIEPTLETVRLYERIREGRFDESPQVPQAGKTSGAVPAQFAPFIGREAELNQIANLLAEPSCQLITLVGPGGVGKSRLALQAATQTQDDFLHGVYFVLLAAVGADDTPLFAIAEALNLPLSGAIDPKVQLLNDLQEKELLIVLDNFEHLVSNAGLLVEILAAAPEVKLIVTSRERLNLQSEWVLAVPGLNCPQPGPIETIKTYSAVQLFAQSARRVQPGFLLTQAEASFIIRICQLVEGLPLGIELAATWTRLLSCREIAEEIARDLDFLNTTSLQGVATRHQSLRAVFDHSWQLLSPAERTAVKNLSVFRGGFGRDAAETVAGASLPLLSALVDKSLLRWNAAGKYDMHPLLRQYVLNKLRESTAEQAAIVAGYSRFYANFLKQQEADLKGSRQEQALAEIGAEIDNIQAAWRWMVEQRQLELVEMSLECLYRFFEIRGRFQEGQRLFERAVEQLRSSQTTGGNIVLGELLARWGGLLDRLGRYEQAIALLQESLSIFEASNARRKKAFPLERLGYISFMQGQYSASKQFLEESLSIHREDDDRWGIINALNHLGDVVIALGMYSEAESVYQESLALSKALGARGEIGWAYLGLGDVNQRQGNHGAAKRYYEQSLSIFEEIQAYEGIAWAYHGLGDAAIDQQSYAEAKQYYRQSLISSRQIGDRASEAETLNGLASVHIALEAYQQASENLLEALPIAVKTQSIPIILDILTRWALVLVVDSKNKGGLVQEQIRKRAITLLAYVLQHPACDQETNDYGATLLAELESQLSPQVITAIRAQVKTMVLEEIVAEILAEAQW